MSSPSAPSDGHGASVVLVHPEIPPNTGNIGRLCAATRTPLHLVEPLGFSLDDRYLRRAGLDYWKHLEWHRHPSWRAYCAARPDRTRYYFSARSEASIVAAPLADQPNIDLIFGCETGGLPEEVLAQAEGRIFCIPMANPAVRSFNLANAVAITLYETLRQRGGLG